MLVIYSRGILIICQLELTENPDIMQTFQETPMDSAWLPCRLQNIIMKSMKPQYKFKNSCSTGQKSRHIEKVKRAVTTSDFHEILTAGSSRIQDSLV